MNDEKNVKTENAVQAAPQNDIMPQAQQYRSMWNDTEMLTQAWKCAGFLGQSALVPETYKGHPENCLIALDLANRSGMSPLTVMQNLYIVHGNPSFSSKFLIACINASGRYTPLRYEWAGKRGTDEYGCRGCIQL